MRLRDRGFALIIVLVAVIGVFALAMQSAVMSRSATIEARVLRERAEGERAAASAATLVLLALTGNDVSGSAALDDGPGFSGFGGGSGSSGGSGGDDSDEPSIELPPIIREMLGAKADELEKGARDGSNQGGAQQPRSTDGGGITGRVSRGSRIESEPGLMLPGKPIDVSLEANGSAPSGLLCRVWLADAVGGLNINAAQEEEIRRYFSLKVADPLTAASLTDELLDWRDADDFIRPHGAEREAHMRRGVVCRNGAFVSREELMFLPSMTPEIFESLRDDMSVEGDDVVHVGSASRELLASLPGMDTEVVDAIVKLRDSGELTEESLDAAIPMFAREAKDRLRLRSSTILRLRVQVQRGPDDAGFIYEGLAVAGERGIRALGLKPL